MTPEQVDVFARGLYHVAQVDGVDDREVQLIHEFLKEAEAEELGKGLANSRFHVAELAVLETSFLKRVFLKACLVLVRRDGVITDAERDVSAQIAEFLGLEDDFAAIDAEAAGESF